MSNRFDVMIIGRGILGLTTAFYLLEKDPNLKVAIVGEEERLTSATIAAGAMLNCFCEVTPETFSSPYAQAKFTISIEAAKRWPDLLNALNLTLPEFGTYVILNSRNGGLDEENFHLIEHSLKAHNSSYEQADPHKISGLNPIMDYRPLKALYLPQERYVNPCTVLLTLEKVLKRRNCHFVNAYVTKLERQEVDYKIETTQQSVSAQEVVIAAGAFSQTFIDQFEEVKRSIPTVLSSVGCAMLLRSNEITLDSVIRTPIRAGSCGIHMVPYGSGLIYVGATAYFSLKPESMPKVRYPYNLQRNAIQQFNHNFHNAFIEKILLGNRPVTIDTFPLVGKTSLKGLWILTGTYRDGFHDSPVLGNYLAEQILNSPSNLKHPFQPERVPLQLFDKQTSIDETVKHLIASNYEYGMVLPIAGLNFEEKFTEGCRKKLIEVYETVDPSVGLPIEMLVMLLRAEKGELLKFKETYRKLTRISGKLHEEMI